MWALHAQRGNPQMIALALELQRKQGGQAVMEDGDDNITVEERASYWRELLKSSNCFPYYVNPDGGVVHSLDEDWNDRLRAGAVAVVPVLGTLVHEAWVGEEVFYGLVSSQRIAAFLDKCRTEPRIAAVVANIKSPGGQVDGMENLGRSARELSAVKPTEAHIDCMAASGGYWLASQFRSIRLDGQLSEVGSVGVMLSFFDVIPALESWGLKYHELYAKESDKKNEAWRQLRTEDDPEKYKQELGFVAEVFRSTVKLGRGARLGNDPATLEGRMYSGQLAIDAGMADSLGSLDQSIQHVRGISGAQAPTADPAEPDPANNTATNPAPGTDDDGGEDAQQKPKPTNGNMSLKNKLIALATALFSSKEEITEANLTEANTELQAQGIEGVQFASTAQLERAANANALVDAAEKNAKTAEGQVTAAEERATTAEALVSTANETIAAAMKEHGIEAQEGKSPLECVLASLAADKMALKTADMRIAELERMEPAPPSTASNASGDIRTVEKDPETLEFEQQVERDLAALKGGK